MDEGVKIGEELLKDVRFADDQAMTANNNQVLQVIMDRLNTTVKEYGLKINVEKDNGDENLQNE